MIRGIVTLSEVIPFIGTEEKIFGGVAVSMTTPALAHIKEKGTSCKKCGLRGNMFKIMKGAVWHLVLYHDDIKFNYKEELICQNCK